MMNSNNGYEDDDDIVADEEMTGAGFMAGSPGLPKDV